MRSAEHDRDASDRSLARLLTNGSATLMLFVSLGTLVVILTALGYASAPIFRTDALASAVAALAVASLLALPLVVRRVRSLSRLSSEGVVVEGRHDGWADARPRWVAIVSPESEISCPRYAYTYLGTTYHTLWVRYWATRDWPATALLLVDPRRPRSAIVLRGVEGERVRGESIPPLSTHIVPWLRHLGPSAKGCGCAFLIFMIGLGFTGSYGWTRSDTEGPLFYALVVIGLAAPVVAVLHALFRAILTR